MRAFLVWLEFLGEDYWNYGLGPFILINAIKEFKPRHYMLGNQLLNSVKGFEEDLNRFKGWTSCTPLVKPVRGGR